MPFLSLEHHTHNGVVIENASMIGTTSGEELRQRTGLGYALGPWYEFLELEGLHHHVRFVELDEDTELETEKTLEYEWRSI